MTLLLLPGPVQFGCPQVDTCSSELYLYLLIYDVDLVVPSLVSISKLCVVGDNTSTISPGPANWSICFFFLPMPLTASSLGGREKLTCSPR